MRGRCTLVPQRALSSSPSPLQEAARCQLSASSSTSRSGPTPSVCADSLVRGLLVWRTEYRTGLVRVRTILGLDCENDGWMDVRTVHGCFLTADRTSFGLVPCLVPVLLLLCFVLPGFALGLVLPMGNQPVYLFGDARLRTSYWVSKFLQRVRAHSLPLSGFCSSGCC